MVKFAVISELISAFAVIDPFVFTFVTDAFPNWMVFEPFPTAF